MSHGAGRFVALLTLFAAIPSRASAFRAEAAQPAASQSAATTLIGIDAGGSYALRDGHRGLSLGAPSSAGTAAQRPPASEGSSGGGSAFVPDSMLQDDPPAQGAKAAKAGGTSKDEGKSSKGDDVGASRDLRSKRQAWYRKRKSNPALNERVKAYRDGAPYRVTVLAVGDGEYAASKAAWAFFQLRQKARKDGVGIEYLSGFRTYAEQAYLYRKYGSPRAARPGYSNHQQGLSMDIEGVNGYGTRAYQWLKRNAPKFGIRNDVPNEYWHWTYVR